MSASTPPPIPKSPMRKLEHGVESVIFAGRWLLAPLYIGLTLSLIIILIKFIQQFVNIIGDVTHDGMEDIVLVILQLVDIVLLANLVLIVVFSGYENYVSKIRVADKSEDRPSWMGKVDFSGLKIKLIGSLVAISVIQLLQDFLNPAGIDPEQETWRIAIHLTFVVSGVLFAVMDYIADKRATVEVAASKGELELRQMEKQAGMTKEQDANVDPMGE